MLILLCVLGLAAGLLLNILADDLPPDAAGRRHAPRWPHCQVCATRRSPWDWLALASLAVGRGRCPACGASRRRRHLVVETATALGLPGLWLWATMAPGAPPSASVAALRFAGAVVAALVLLLIAVTDIEHRLILHVVAAPAAVAIAAVQAVVPGRGLGRSLAGGLAGYGLMLGVFVLAQVLGGLLARARGRPLPGALFGGGDVNLGGIVGLAVGWPGVLLALLLAIVAAGAFGLGQIASQLALRRYRPFSGFPLAPFLAGAGLAVYLYGRQIALWLAG